jgi:hypothetical protein
MVVVAGGGRLVCRKNGWLRGYSGVLSWMCKKIALRTIKMVMSGVSFARLVVF